jgi:hypothetical protein
MVQEQVQTVRRLNCYAAITLQTALAAAQAWATKQVSGGGSHPCGLRQQLRQERQAAQAGGLVWLQAQLCKEAG